MIYTVPLTATTVIYLPIILEETRTPPPTPATPTPTETPYAPPSDVRIIGVGAIGTPETATVWNIGAGAQDMTGWSLFEVAGLHTYHFPDGYILAPGALRHTSRNR